MLEHAHRHAHRRGAAAQHISPLHLRQMLPHRFADLVVMTQPVACTAREQVVPALLAGLPPPPEPPPPDVLSLIFALATSL